MTWKLEMGVETLQPQDHLLEEQIMDKMLEIAQNYLAMKIRARMVLSALILVHQSCKYIKVSYNSNND